MKDPITGMNRDVKITVAHDYFTQRGGAERVAATLISGLQPDRVLTAVLDAPRTFPLPAQVRVETSILQRISIFRHDPRRALPAFPLAWWLLRPVDDGVVICSSSGWSHAIRTTKRARKIVYCHNPARWLYQPEDYFKDQPFAIRTLMRALRPLLKAWDSRAAANADIYIANSRAVARRIERIYNRPALVLHPPVSLDPQGQQVPVAGLDPGYFVTVGRGRGYKNIQNLIAAFAQTPSERLVVVGTPPFQDKVPSNVQSISHISDAELRWVYSNSRALISVSHEDFGLTPLEANSLGTPALVLRAGGFLDSLAEGISGTYVDDTSPDSIKHALDTFPSTWDMSAIKDHASKFSKESFISQLQKIIDDMSAAAKPHLGGRGFDKALSD